MKLTKFKSIQTTVHQKKLNLHREKKRNTSARFVILNITTDTPGDCICMQSMEIFTIRAPNVAIKQHRKADLSHTLNEYTGEIRRSVHFVMLRSKVWVSTSGTNTHNITKYTLAANAHTDLSTSQNFKRI